MYYCDSIVDDGITNANKYWVHSVAQIPVNVCHRCLQWKWWNPEVLRRTNRLAVRAVRRPLVVALSDAGRSSASTGRCRRRRRRAASRRTSPPLTPPTALWLATVSCTARPSVRSASRCRARCQCRTWCQWRCRCRRPAGRCRSCRGAGAPPATMPATTPATTPAPSAASWAASRPRRGGATLRAGRGSLTGWPRTWPGRRGTRWPPAMTTGQRRVHWWSC